MGAGKTMSTGVAQKAVDLLYLCGRALAGEAADSSRVQDMNLPAVHALAVSQSLSALAWYGLESAAESVQLAEPLVSSWRGERDKNVRRQMLFGAERAQVLSWMVENGIWFALLKGAVLVDWYPRVGMREFSDNDILYDSSRRSDVARFFKGRGYARNADGHAAGINDSYTKEPVYRFEMHRHLFSESSSWAVARYFEGLEGRLVAVDGSPFNRQLTREDFYLFLIAHAFKHYRSGGTGVRILCDLRVFLSREGEALDRLYVEHKFDELEMGEFARGLERLAACVFSPDFRAEQLSAEDAELLRSLTSYGTYGTVDHQAELKMERMEEQGGSTGRYVFSRFVPDDAWWDVNFPIGNRHRWLRPPLLVFRYVRAALSPERRQRIAAELKALMCKAEDRKKE